MSADWFVILAPLAALPIVLLFVFVGCTLNREGALAHYHVGVQLDIVSGFDTSDIATLEVSMGYTLNTGESPPNLRAGTKLTATDLANIVNSGGGWIEVNLDLTDQPDGELDCICTITMTGLSPPAPIIVPPPWVGPATLFISPADVLDVTYAFQLSRSGNNFDLVAGAGYVAFEGGP